ncbi:MAG TPA: NfeD family protein [Arthrobacter sp.]|nr:NfeD family protein [Arthrobacter sp.]
MTAIGAHAGAIAATGSDFDLLDEFRSVLSSLIESLGLGWDLILGLVVPTLILALGGLFLAVWLWRRSRPVSSSSGTDHFRGQIVTVRSAEGTHALAFVEGSWWSLHSTGGPLQAGDQVRVRAVEGLFLVVDPLTGEAPAEEET